MTPEQKARQKIDRQLEQCGWLVQDYRSMDLSAGPGVPLPPLAEQVAIFADVDHRLSMIDDGTSRIEASVKRAARLRQAILHRAFEGKLVPQDPSDEPANMLLEQIVSSRRDCRGSGNGKLHDKQCRHRQVPPKLNRRRNKS